VYPVIFQERSRSVNAGPRNIAARRLIGGATSLATAVSLTGCYAFIPSTSATLPERTPVTVELTMGGTVALADVVGQNVIEVEGAIVRSSADSLVMAVEHTYTTQRQKFSSSGTEVSLPRSYIQVVKVRTFSRKRTVLLIAGTIAGSAVAATLGTAGGSSSGDGGGGGPIQAAVRKP
jgi:hypothetical protein